MRALLLLLLLSPSLAAQNTLFWSNRQLTAVPAATHDAEVLVRALLAGPPAPHFTSALPPGTSLHRIAVDGNRVVVVLGSRLLVARALGTFEDALEQVTKTLNSAGFDHVDIRIRTDAGEQSLAEALGELTDPTPARPRTPTFEPGAVPGALTGKTIAISPGHGFYWHSTLGWTTQRGNIGGLIEDIHTNEISFHYLIPMLENMGARVVVCRERGEMPTDVLGDNDQGAPRYTETGTWFTSASSGYGGGSYRYATTTFTTSATATFTLPVPADGLYPVYVFFRAGTNRVPDAAIRVVHSGGTDATTVDQTVSDRTWVFVGNYHFTTAGGATIHVDNASSLAGRVVIADAVRLGGGLGSIARGAGTSGKLRWQEAGRYWAQFAGAPPSVYDSISGGQDNDDDVTSRPRFSEWVGGCDAYVSLHTNAGGGLGTSTYIYNGGATAGSAALQTAVHNQIVADIRANYEPAWTDRGRLSANFGEVRLLSTMPGILVELAFHDVAGSRDHDALHDPIFRYISGRAMARGVLRYFAPGATFPLEPPLALRVTQDGARGLRVTWEPVVGATAYSIEVSPDGRGFTEIAQTGTNTWSTGPLPPDTVRSFRVRTWNASGRSEPTEVLSAGTSHTGTAECLLVQAFDRLERNVKLPDNRRDYLRLHADAIARHGEYSLGFDAATNEAVALLRVPLNGYRVVDWAAGEESTADETFSSLEQNLITAYLAQGGRLLATGAEIGWDLEARGSAADKAFYNQQLGARYVADDAGTYSFSALPGGIFAGLGGGLFDDGSGGTYDVDYPDVIAPNDANSTLCLTYAGNQGAGIQRSNGTSRVVHLGFPLETVRDANLRGALMARALRFLLSPRALEAPATLPLGATSAVSLSVPSAANRFYILAASTATTPALPLPGGHILPLAPDALFSLSLTSGNGVFVNFFGQLDAQGQGAASIVIPALPHIIGLPIVVSGFTLVDLSGLTVHTMLPWVRGIVR